MHIGFEIKDFQRFPGVPRGDSLIFGFVGEWYDMRVVYILCSDNRLHLAYHVTRELPKPLARHECESAYGFTQTKCLLRSSSVQTMLLPSQTT